MGEALQEYAECRAEAFAWALGRFIVPVSRLAELKRGIEAFPPPGGETRRFLENGDEVIFRGRAERAGSAALGFGECRGIITS